MNMALYKMITMQLRQYMYSRRFKICFFVLFAYVMVTYLYYVVRFLGADYQQLYSAYTLYAGQDYLEFHGFFVLYFPVFIVFPASFIYLNDKNSGILPILQAKSGLRNYYISKVLAAFLGGFLVFFVPFLLNMLLNLMTFPLDKNTLISNWGTFTQEYCMLAQDFLFLSVYLNHPLLYNIIFLFWMSGFAGLVSAFLVSFSFFIKRYKIFLLVPFYLIVMISQMFTNSFSFQTDIIVYLFAAETTRKSLLYFLTVIGGLIGFTIIATWLKCKRQYRAVL